jgi:hypothetical protein
MGPPMVSSQRWQQQARRTPLTVGSKSPVGSRTEGSGTPTTFELRFCCSNLLVRLSLVLPKYFVLFEREVHVQPMSSEDRLRVVSLVTDNTTLTPILFPRRYNFNSSGRVVVACLVP